MKRCPCCGAPYNGKRCRECYYEPFTEEIAHGMHTHEGEPLVIEHPEDRPVRRSVPTRQKECRQYSGRRKKTSPKWLWPILIVTAFMVAQYVLTEFITGKVSSMSSLWSDDGDTWETEAVIRPEDFHHQTVLYDKGGILAVADWRDGDTYTEEIPVYVRNGSDKDVMLMSSMDCVNGYMTEYRLFLGEVEAGQEEMTSIWIDDTDLKGGNIEKVGKEIERRIREDTPDEGSCIMIVGPGWCGSVNPNEKMPLLRRALPRQALPGMLLRAVYRGDCPRDAYPRGGTAGH